MSYITSIKAKQLCVTSVSTLFSVLAACSYAADSTTSDSALSKLVQDSTTKVSFRYRYEGVDQDGFNNDANANTVRSRVTWTSGKINNFSAKLEFDDVRTIADDDYNSTANGNGGYPVVADPEGTELNQAYIQYKNDGLTATVGRQRINLDDQRFIGGVGWRQNEQTYDAVRLAYKSNKAHLDYSYISNVNRIFGPDGAKANLKGGTHLINARFDISKQHSLSAFNYLLDFDRNAGLSSNTYGLRYVAKLKPLKITASYARQSDAGDNTVSYDADYWNIDLSGKVGEIKWRLGQETLGSDGGRKAFNTPLATLHKFQGFADKFLGTPAGGVEDNYLGIGSKVGAVKLSLTYHQLASDYNGIDYGKEWDFTAAYKVNKNLKTLLKYADFQSDDYASDTRKIWFQVVYSL